MLKWKDSFCLDQRETYETDNKLANEEFRWQILKAILDYYPELKEKVKSYFDGKVS